MQAIGSRGLPGHPWQHRCSVDHSRPVAARQNRFRLRLDLVVLPIAVRAGLLKAMSFVVVEDWMVHEGVTTI